MNHKVLCTVAYINILLNFIIIVKSLPVDIEKQATVDTISVNNIDPHIITVNGLPYKGK